MMRILFARDAVMAQGTALALEVVLILLLGFAALLVSGLLASAMLALAAELFGHGSREDSNSRNSGRAR